MFDVPSDEIWAFSPCLIPRPVLVCYRVQLCVGVGVWRWLWVWGWVGVGGWVPYPPPPAAGQNFPLLEVYGDTNWKWAE